MEKEPKKILLSFIPGFVFVGLLWLVYFIEMTSGFRLSEFGVQPRELAGLKGVLLSPFLHGDLKHLTSNSIPLLVLVTGLIYFYRQIALKVLLGVWILGGFWLWLGGRDSYHIGASGIIYGLTAFLFFSGMLRKDTRLMALSMLVVFLYGGMVWGIFPIFHGVSWEAHLFGGIAGLFMAWIYRGEGPQRKMYEWELEPEDDDESVVEETNTAQQPPQILQEQHPLQGQVHIHYIYRSQQPGNQPPPDQNPESHDKKD